MNFTSINPIQTLIYSSIINGMISLPMIIFTIRIENGKSILKDKINIKRSNTIGCCTINLNSISIILCYSQSNKRMLLYLV